jgi:hypothetical protein
MEAGTRFVPFTVSVIAPLPAGPELGEIEASVGKGLSIVKVKALEVPPPGDGLATVIDAAPEDAI